MKEIRGMKRGAKLDPQPTTSQRVQQLDVDVKNMQTASRLNQLMVQQLLQNLQGMSRDLGKAYGLINELQYKVLAIVGELDADAISRRADELRLKDFNEASDAEDSAQGLMVGDTVQEDSTVIIASIAAEGDGIFRSRIKLAECGSPALIEGFAGQPVGTKVKAMLNGVEHEVELLGIRNPTPGTESTEHGEDGSTLS